MFEAEILNPKLHFLLAAYFDECRVYTRQLRPPQERLSLI